MTEEMFTPDEKIELGTMLKKLADEMRENPIVTQYDMVFPLTIKGVQSRVRASSPDMFRTPVGSLVKIRPCGDEHKGQTYLGIYLGDLMVDVLYAFRPKTEMIEILSHNNPAIFVPKLKKIVWGMESWWGKIENETELSDITDNDIENVWYVKMLKSQLTKDEDPTKNMENNTPVS